MADVKLTAKVEKLDKYFKENKLDMFALQNVEDAMSTGIFRVNMELKSGEKLPAAILLDGSVYSLIQVQLGMAAVKGYAKVAKIVNNLNNGLRMFKVTVTDNGDVLLNAPLIFAEDKFEPVMVHAIVIEILKFLETNHKVIMDALKSADK